MSSKIKTEHNPWKPGDESIILELAKATNKAIEKGFKPLDERCYLTCYKVALELDPFPVFIEGRVQVPEELKPYMKELDDYYHYIIEYKSVWWDPHCSMVFGTPSDPLPMNIISRLSMSQFEDRLRSNEQRYGKEKVWGGKVIPRQTIPWEEHRKNKSK